MIKPFLLKPSGKDYIWGGTRLRDDFSKNIDLNPLAETWECSTHPDGPSYVATGEFEGLTLTELLLAHPEIVGHVKCPKPGELPVLIKFIDAKNDLSVQVHPDDEYAFRKENGQLGKNEMWYVVDAEEDSELVFGINHSTTPLQIKKAIQAGILEKYLNRIKIHKDDVFFIKAGTIHAIGKGAVIAEIQQNSNLTYRLYDYNRRDKQGNLRPLHIKKALDVAYLEGVQEPRQPMRIMNFRPGFASESLCQNKYFKVDRYLINTERVRNLAVLNSVDTTFRVLLCCGGCGTLYGSDGFSLNFIKGDCVFIPAGTEELKIHGVAQLLCTSC